MSLAEIAMVSCVELTNAVDRAVPLKFTMEPVTKFDPFTVRVNPAAPATALVGLIDEIVGEGLNTVNSTEVEAPPPGSGLKTKTTPVPPLAMSLLRISALSCVVLTNVAFRACPPK
jgi:hypothetical protein